MYPTLTANDVVHAYIEHGRTRWSPNTIRKVTKTAGGVYRQTIGPMIATSITPRDAQAWASDLETRYAWETTAQTLRIFRASFTDYVRLEILPRNPFDVVRIAPRPRRHHTTWSIDHVRAVLDHIGDNTQLRAIYLTAITTGMRPGEWRALQWSDLDWDASTIIVRRTITKGEDEREYIGTDTKTHRHRAVVLPRALTAELEHIRIEQLLRRDDHPDWHDHNLIFDRGNGNFVRAQSVRRRQQRMCADLDIPYIRLHDLRHTHGTIEALAGTNMKIIAERLGHATTAYTMDQYVHFDAEGQRRSVEALAARLGL